ncbi:MAG: hypothetical protein E6X99_23110 [Pantoea sp.]|nr:hypothetical protein [Pantoea sp.]
MDLHTILLALPAIRHLPDALIFSGALTIGWNLFCEIEEQRK